MKQHVSFVGALHVGFGVLGLLGALAIYLLLRFAIGYVEYDPVASQLIPFVGNFITLVIIFFSSLGIIGGIGLFSYRSWARILVLIVSAINCLNVPVGTAKGVYSIWVLMQKETIDLFEPLESPS
ncbi:MAG TPA: hypothetical protein ENO20_08740 [Bacteroides sp.]|nr:hypothetical protein [Bacteroides sp.]